MAILTYLIGTILLGDCLPPQTCCCQSPTVYVGGAASYIDTHFPQGQLALDTPSHSKANYLGWLAYAGIQMASNAEWLLGLEVGYKDLAKFKMTADFSTRATQSNAWDGQAMVRYLHCSGINFFFKGGAAFVTTKLTEEGPLFPARERFHLRNIYPEITLGVGLYLASCLNLVASWSHIFGPCSTTRYLQDFSSGVSLRPAQAPGFDLITLGLEFSMW